jgi:hypothetical protein
MADSLAIWVFQVEMSISLNTCILVVERVYDTLTVTLSPHLTALCVLTTFQIIQYCNWWTIMRTCIYFFVIRLSMHYIVCTTLKPQKGTGTILHVLWPAQNKILSASCQLVPHIHNKYSIFPPRLCNDIIIQL